MKNRSTYVMLGIVLSLFLTTGCGISSGGEATVKPDIYTDNSNIDFAGTVLGNYIDRSINISNNGHSNLDIGQISSSGQPFSISSDTCSNNTLSPSETCSMKVRFKPTNQGSSTGTLVIPSNDPDSATTTVGLSGEGYGLNVWINKIDLTNYPYITVAVTVTGPSGPLIGLLNSDFLVKIKNTGITAFNFTGYTPDPVSAVITLDCSSSLLAELDAINDASKHFINQLTDTDEAAICKFKDEFGFFPNTIPLLLITDTPGKTTLNDYIDNLFIAEDGTALYNAVFNSLDRATEGTNNKLAVIALSDGVNTHAGGKTLPDVINKALIEEIPIFSIYYVDQNVYPDATPEIMQQMAFNTGGQYYNTVNSNELEDIYEQIANVLSNKYTITFQTTYSSEPANIEIRAEDSGGLYGIDSRTVELP